MVLFFIIYTRIYHRHLHFLLTEMEGAGFLAPALMLGRGSGLLSLFPLPTGGLSSGEPSPSIWKTCLQLGSKGRGPPGFRLGWPKCLAPVKRLCALEGFKDTGPSPLEVGPILYLHALFHVVWFHSSVFFLPTGIQQALHHIALWKEIKKKLVLVTTVWVGICLTEKISPHLLLCPPDSKWRVCNPSLP